MPLPKPRVLGIEISRGLTTPRMPPQSPVTRVAQPALPIRRWTRNGQTPNAWLASALGEAMNQAAMLRTKEVFRAVDVTPNILGGIGGSRARWRWAFHTGPLAHQLMVVCVMQATQNITAGDSYATVQVDKLAGGGTQSDEFHAGANPAGLLTALGWQYLRTFTTYLPVDPDTDYVGLFTDADYACVQSACVFELASMTTNFGGYFPQNLPAGAPILSTDRQRMMQLARSLWRRGGAHVLNWFVGQSATGPRSIATTTLTNIIDGATTAIAASSPGYTLDMRYKDRVSQTSGVPCRLWVYGWMGSAGASGTLYLKNSAGTTITSIAGFTTTPGWQLVDFTLPATLDKYDLLAANGGAGTTIKLAAVSIAEYEP